MAGREDRGNATGSRWIGGLVALFLLSACTGFIPGGVDLGKIPTYVTEYATCFRTFGHGCKAPGPGGKAMAGPATSFDGMVRGAVSLTRRSRGGLWESTEATVRSQRYVEVATARAKVDAALRVLEHEFVTKTLPAYVRSVEAGAARGASGAAVMLSITEVSGFVSVLNRTPPEAWHHLHARALASAEGCQRVSDEKSVRFTKYLAEYFSAYFRHGNVAELRVDLTKVAEKVHAWVKERYSELAPADLEAKFKEVLEDWIRPFLTEAQYAKIKKITDALWDYVANGTLPGDVTLRWGFTLGDEDSPGFVTRAGLPLSFPVLRFDVVPMGDEPLKIPDVDFEKIGAELVRVFIEASMDAWLGTPAAAGEATGTLITGSDPNGKPYRLPRFSEKTCYRNAAKDITAADFAFVDQGADYIEGAVGSAVGRLIRGIGPFSLDNEAIAALVEVALAVAARKVSEKAIWCALVHSAIPKTLGDGDDPSARWFEVEDSPVFDVPIQAVR